MPFLIFWAADDHGSVLNWFNNFMFGLLTISWTDRVVLVYLWWGQCYLVSQSKLSQGENKQKTAIIIDPSIYIVNMKRLNHSHFLRALEVLQGAVLAPVLVYWTASWVQHFPEFNSLIFIFRGSLEEAENDIDLLEAKLEKVYLISGYHYIYSYLGTFSFMIS